MNEAGGTTSHRSNSYFLLIYALVLTLSCNKSIAQSNGTSTSPSRDVTWIRITSVDPDTSIPLHTGKNVLFTVAIEYNLVEPSGAINLVIQSGSGSVLASFAKAVSEGSGKAKLKKSIHIPANIDTIEVFTPILVQGETQTRITDIRFYKVR